DLLSSLDSLQNSLLGNGDKWVAQMRELYEKKRNEYKLETGRDLNMTQAQFMDLVNKNVRDQLIDSLFMLSLFAMFLAIKALKPDDDEEDYMVKNSHKFLLKAV